MIDRKILMSVKNAEIISVESTGKLQNEEWSWRLWYVGKRGDLYVVETRRRKYIHFTCYGPICQSDDMLRTNFGEVTYGDETVSITTINSKYTFRIPRGEYGKA